MSDRRGSGEPELVRDRIVSRSEVSSRQTRATDDGQQQLLAFRAHQLNKAVWCPESTYVCMHACSCVPPVSSSFSHLVMQRYFSSGNVFRSVMKC